MGLRAPPPADRRADRALRAVAEPRRRARALDATSASTARGYPDRLQADAIPLGSRIVAVSDAFDAMTSDRPYAAARTPEEALDELRRCAGTQFDPAVVETFRAVVAERTLRSVA